MYYIMNWKNFFIYEILIYDYHVEGAENFAEFTLDKTFDLLKNTIFFIFTQTKYLFCALLVGLKSRTVLSSANKHKAAYYSYSSSKNTKIVHADVFRRALGRVRYK